MRDDRERERSVALAAHCLWLVLKRQARSLAQRSWSRWRRKDARRRAMGAGAVLVRKVFTAQEDLQVHGRYLFCWNAWVQRTIFLRSHTDLANVTADNAVTRRFMVVRSLARRYLIGKAKVVALNHWRCVARGRTAKRSAARRLLQCSRRADRVATAALRRQLKQAHELLIARLRLIYQPMAHAKVDGDQCGVGLP